MNKDKKESLVKYQTQLANKLTDKVPSKHEGHPETYKEYLKRELQSVTDQLEAAKLEG